MENKIVYLNQKTHTILSTIFLELCVFLIERRTILADQSEPFDSSNTSPVRKWLK